MNANTTVRNEIALIVLLEIHALIVQTMTENMTDAILMVDAERRQRMGDLISRQAAIDAMNEVYCHIEMIKNRPVNKTEQAMYLDMIGAMKSVPSAQTDLDEWCTDCKEYDQERHCCPRFNRVIRKTVEEVRQNAQPESRWIPVNERLPEVEKGVLISYHFDSDNEEFFPSHDGVTISWWSGVKNHGKLHFPELGDNYEVIAWMPLPESYRGE